MLVRQILISLFGIIEPQVNNGKFFSEQRI